MTQNNNNVAQWIEIGKRYVLSDGRITEPLERTPAQAICGDTHPYTSHVPGIAARLHWDREGKSFSRELDIVDEHILVDVNEMKEFNRYNQDLDFLYDMKSETINARSKFSNVDLALALTEEFGEIIKALLDQKQKKRGTSSDIYNECVQAAAMAMRLATEGDPNFPDYVPPQSGKE